MACGIPRALTTIIPAPPTTTVVIVSYRRSEALRRLLESVVAPELDVIVVNVEDDPAVDEVARVAALPVRVIVIGNRGYVAAVNAGAAAALGDVVVFTNDDVVLTTAAVVKLAAVLRGGGVDVALPRVVTSQGVDLGTVLALATPERLLVEWALLPDHPVAALDGRIHVEKWRRPLTQQVVEAGTASVVATWTHVLRNTKLPEHYFLYWEEMEWFWRLREDARCVVVEPGVTVVHDGGRDDVRPEKSRLLAATRCVVCAGRKGGVLRRGPMAS